MNRPDFTAKNAPKIAEAKLSSCGLKTADSKKIVIAELRSPVAEQHFFKRCGMRLRKCFLLVAELRLRTQKKVARAHLWWLRVIYDSQATNRRQEGLSSKTPPPWCTPINRVAVI
jgi:hypothetical protein